MANQSERSNRESDANDNPVNSISRQQPADLLCADDIDYRRLLSFID
jgi:hypothetical protein